MAVNQCGWLCEWPQWWGGKAGHEVMVLGCWIQGGSWRNRACDRSTGKVCRIPRDRNWGGSALELPASAALGLTIIEESISYLQCDVPDRHGTWRVDKLAEVPLDGPELAPMAQGPFH